jgi:hypothetical protein
MKKIIAKCDMCGVGGVCTFSVAKYYLWTPNDDLIRFDFLAQKEFHAECVCRLWRELKFYKKM